MKTRTHARTRMRICGRAFQSLGTDSEKTLPPNCFTRNAQFNVTVNEDSVTELQPSSGMEANACHGLCFVVNHMLCR